MANGDKPELDEPMREQDREDDDDDSSSDVSDIDIDPQVAAAVMALEAELEASPGSYDKHLEVSAACVNARIRGLMPDF